MQLAVLLGMLSAAVAGPAGVVVSRVAPESLAERAGLRAGDLLTTWEQQDGSAHGVLRSPFDVVDLELERAPRGALRLAGSRSGEALTASLFPDEWGLEVRPSFEGADEQALGDALRQARDGSTELALAGLQRLLTRTGEEPLDARTWLLLQLARLHAQGGRLDEAKRLVDQAARVAGQAGRPLSSAQLHAWLAAELQRGGRLEEALAACDEALALRRSAAPDSLAVAASLRQKSVLAFERGKALSSAREHVERARTLLERFAPESLAMVRTLNTEGKLSTGGSARPLLERALEIGQRLAPESLLVAETLEHLARNVGDLNRALELGQRALAIRERLAPDSLDRVRSLRQIGASLRESGEIGAAEQHLRQALDLVQRLAPSSSEHVATLNTLAILRKNVGDLTEAEGLYRQLLEITQVRRPDSVWAAKGLLNLGTLHAERRDLPGAEALARRALAIAEREAPGSDLVGYCLTSLASFARERGDDGEAESSLRRALATFRAASPVDRMIPDVLSELGGVFAGRGRRKEAEALYREALQIDEARSRRSGTVARLHDVLGELALGSGDLDTAERQHAEALALREELAPGSVWHAESAYALGRVALERGHTDEALGLFERAASALDEQSRRLGGDRETQARFRSHYQQVYRALEELLLLKRRNREAFSVFERSRARGLLSLLATRDLQLDHGAIPAGLEQERRRADADHDRLVSQLASAPEAARRAAVRQELEQVRRRQLEVRARIRDRAPRLAAVRDPEPLDLAGVRQVLDPGTLLLAFSIGPEHSRVYVLGPGPRAFEVRTLDVAESALRADVERFRELIATRRAGLLRGALRAQADKLTRLLLGPLAKPLAEARRVLVVPDGVLHLLPFAALGDPSNPSRRRYLVESKPLHVVSSVTLYARLSRRQAGASRPTEVVGFADPDYPRTRAGTASLALERAQESGLRLAPLPYTREEADALKALAPSARIWTGAQATEERAKSVSSARVLHFACHGFVDEAFPLESGLALAIPAEWADGKENGLLQAWEIFEGPSIDADLVTLSACQTGLGKEVAGEGLLGLTWAFQYAGARSVLSSLWEVSDASTGTLMRSLYGHIAAGKPKAEALRAAQIEVLRRPSTAAPYFWAAFQLVGDWR